MDLTPLQEQIDWVASNEQDKFTEAEEETLENYKKQIRTAQSLKKKSIFKIARKAPQNPISLALFCNEFDSLTLWQKEECLKNAQKYFTDCGVNWQLKNEYTLYTVTQTFSY